jgi:glycoprotein-N-acetylgalactosamine 3-beta-galactosyltransferase
MVKDDFDWFYRADDDTYAIMENLRLMLLPYSPNDNYYFGFHANASKIEHRNDSFVASGAGFLLSRSALKKLLRDGLNDESKCEQGDHVFDDQKLSDCLANLGIPVTDSRDRLGRHRFMAVPPDRVLVPVQLAKMDSNWIHYWTQYPLKQVR